MPRYRREISVRQGGPLIRDNDDFDKIPDLDETAVGDDRLRLIFTCCHAALSSEAQIALTLRTLWSLTTPEIARIFLIPESTLARGWFGPNAKFRTRAYHTKCLLTTCFLNA